MHRNIYNLFKYLLFCIYSFYFLGTGSDPNVPRAEIVYSHVLWLMVQNRYDENHPAMLEMVDRLREVKECADIQREKKGQGQ